jgi:phosphoribosylformylglycinamidine synthase subunit PurSL
MLHRIEVAHKPDVPDASGRALVRRVAADLGITLTDARVVQVYTLDWDLSPDQLDTARQRLFTDPITQYSTVNAICEGDFDWAVEVGFLPGVTDNVGRTSRDGVRDLLNVCAEGAAVYSSLCYLLRGSLERVQVERIAALLSNPLIHRAKVLHRDDVPPGGIRLEAPKVTLAPNPRVDLVDMNLEEPELLKLGSEGILDRVEDGREIRRGPLALDLDSLRVIRDYFNSKGRKPTDVELEALAQTWSEHCKHTIFAAQLDEIDSLYKSTIQKATREVRRQLGEKDWCVSVFTDNSGVVRFLEDVNICYKVETHNSPSALDPYGGAITGIVGVNRDPLGTGLGARLVTNMYGFCFGNPYYDKELPYRKPGRQEQILHPKVIFEGVREGVEHGGNKSGVPTSWGFLSFDDRYMGKPLVFVGTLGVMPRMLHGRPSHEKSARPGDLIVMAGGRVGADGIHGATFSSESLHAGSPTGAVQIGDPITQKKLADAQHEALALGLYSSITDNGAGGLSCSVCEMAKESGGCEVDLSRVPIKYAGLAPNEIWISESQERMTYAVPPENVDALLDLMRRRDVEATVIGRFTDTGRSVVTFEGQTVLDLDMDFLHDGLPKKQLKSQFTPPSHPEPPRPTETDLGDELVGLLAQLNLCSKEYVVRQYDHEVQGGSTIKPLIGEFMDVHSDASVVRPVLGEQAGVALSSAVFPSYGDIDPYQMAACAIDTAVRNQIAVGADPERIALLDNFCWCSSNDPERLGQLKLTALACYDLAVAHRAPYISGKDSMFNDFKGFDGEGNPVAISAPPTILISSVGVIHDVRKAQTLDAKIAGDLVYLVGETLPELGASEYYRFLGERDQDSPYIGSRVPVADAKKTRPAYLALARAIDEGLPASVGSVHLGGLAAALAKCALGGNLGLDLDLDAVPQRECADARDLLFSETQGRLLVTLPPERAARFEELLAGLPCARIGTVSDTRRVVLRHQGQTVADVDLDVLRASYKKTLDW